MGVCAGLTCYKQLGAGSQGAAAEELGPGREVLLLTKGSKNNRRQGPRILVPKAQ